MVLYLPATRFTQCAHGHKHTRAFFCTGFYSKRIWEAAMLLFHWSKVTHQICEGIMTSPPVPGVCDLLPFKDVLAIVLFHLNSTLKSHPSCQPPAVSWLDRPPHTLRTSDKRWPLLDALKNHWMRPGSGDKGGCKQWWSAESELYSSLSLAPRRNATLA